MNPLTISVVIATYNRKDSLLQALGALENQTLTTCEFEVIVVNDGSTDDTVAALESLKSKTNLNFSYFTQNNKGPAAARNRAIEAAKGSIIAFTDDDCIPSMTWLAHIKHEFESNHIIGLQGSTYTDKENITPLTHQIDNVDGNSSVPTCNAAYDRLLLNEIGGFDEEFPFPHNEDADLAWRAQKKGAIGFCREMIVYHPPRADKFKKVLKRMKMLESEFRLYYKDPASYQRYRASSPWKNIYWLVGVKVQLYYFKSRFKFWRRPSLLVQGLLLTMGWWIDLLRLYPQFVRINNENQALFSTSTHTE